MMEDGNHEGCDDTDELLSTDVEGEAVSDFGVCSPAFPRDHCDLLLDAIDAQLSCLQMHSQEGNDKMEDVLTSGRLGSSACMFVSKDTGLGTDKISSTPVGSNADQAELSTAESDWMRRELSAQQKEGCQEAGLGSVPHTGKAAGVGSSRTEQCLWRLEHLLGANTGIAEKKELEEEEDSVCTEDFSSRFLDVMLEPLKLNAASDSNTSGSGGMSSDTTLPPASQVTHKQNLSEPSRKSSIKHLAGVPLKGFDLVTTDSDLESVWTERLRLHLQGTLNNRTAAQRGLMQDGRRAGRASVKTTEQPVNKTLSSDDEDQVNDECVRLYKVLRAQASMQRRERKSPKKRKPSLKSSTPSAAHVNSSCVSVLEREEMDRLLDSAKSELFFEQRKFRHTLDSMQERLEEVNQELEQTQEEGRKLKEKCSKLEEEMARASKNRQELQESVQSERVELESRVEAQEKIVGQQELLLLEMQEEKSRLEREIKALREEQSAKDKEDARLRTQTKLTHAEQLQRVHREVQEVKEAALREQALIHTSNTEAFENHIQVKEQEVKRLQVSLEMQKEAQRRREEELRGETQEQVKKALEQEQRKWEGQRAESLREQQAKLQKQMQEVERRGRAEVEREKRNASVLQNKILVLQKKVEKLESKASVQASALRSLSDEHHMELQKLRRQLQKEAESEAEPLKECVKRSEQELQGLKKTLADCERVQQMAAARHERQNASWAQNIHTECVRLQELFTHNSIAPDNKQLSHSSTVSEAIQELQSFRKPLQHFISSLQNHITTLTHTNQQISTDKESELRLQRELLTTEKEEAVNALKEKLIQEHIEELSSLSRMRLREDDSGTMAASLRRQLQAKDEELQQVQRSMVQWKKKTTARLASTFEQELTSELEKWKVDWLRRRRSSKSTSEQQRRLEQLEGEMRHLTRSYSEFTDFHLASSSSAHISDLTPTSTSHDLSSYKLMRHLQSRIRQLQADTSKHTRSPTLPVPDPNQAGNDMELAGSYLETLGCFPQYIQLLSLPQVDVHMMEKKTGLIGPEDVLLSLQDQSSAEEPCNPTTVCSKNIA